MLLGYKLDTPLVRICICLRYLYLWASQLSEWAGGWQRDDRHNFGQRARYAFFGVVPAPAQPCHDYSADLISTLCVSGVETIYLAHCRLHLAGSLTAFWLATTPEAIFRQRVQAARWLRTDSRLLEESEPLTNAAISSSPICPDFFLRARLCATRASRYGQQIWWML